MISTWIRKYTTWGMRRSLADLLNKGDAAIKDYEIRLQIHRIRAGRISADGFPATAREYLDAFQVPLSRWNIFSRSINPYVLTHMDKFTLSQNIPIAESLIEAINLPLPDISLEVNTEREKLLYEDIRHLTIELQELTRAMDELLKEVGIATKPVFLEIGRLKKEGFRLQGVTPRATIKQLTDHRANLYAFIQSSQRILTQNFTDPST